jgi:hypothetical protein
MGYQAVRSPLIFTATTIPDPPTLVIVTRLKYGFPLTVNRIPPALTQLILDNKKPGRLQPEHENYQSRMRNSSREKEKGGFEISKT